MDRDFSNADDAPRLRTDAARRFKRVDRATAVNLEVPDGAERRFRRLNAPELMKDVYLGAQYVYGVKIRLDDAAA